MNKRYNGLEELILTIQKTNSPVFDLCEIKDGVFTSVHITPSSNCHNSYSVAKAFTVTAIGILEDLGLLSTEEPVFPIFKDKMPPSYDKKWEDVSIRNLLEHKAGFAKGFLDIDWEDVSQYPTDDYLQIILSHPIDYHPGTFYAYSDAVFYLLSRVVSEKTKMRLDDFLNEHIFRPLKFQEFAFSKCPLGYSMGATGLYIATRDMAKLGLLYLNNGMWDGKRILSENFIHKTLGHFEFLGDPDKGYKKGGMHGQVLYISPKLNSVLAIHSFGAKIPDLLSAYLGEDNA